ncbi:MAG: dihydrolipoamide acetyltransferase family protein [Chloroflexi bacterium]|nr:dihydrolipoamide acetyltransferase family protein [Chloroflexota bacterium]
MATALKMPRLSKGMTAGEVMEWHKSPGEPVQAGEPLLIVLSEKAEVEVEAPATGILLKMLVSPGEEAPVGAVLAWIGQPGETLSTAEPAGGRTVTTSVQGVVESESQSHPSAADEPRARLAASGKVRASPAARRVASEAGIALAEITGSGPDGLITESDVKQAIQKATDTTSRPAAGISPREEREVERVPLRGIRRVMARRMALSKSAAAVTTVVDVDMAAIRDFKERVPITYTSAVVKAAALGLQQHDILNAFLEDEEIVFHKRIHVGVAVDAAQGLVVVVMPDANEKSLRQIDDELRRLSGAAKADHLDPEALESPTFTVTNSGVLGSLLFTPIINPPQSATLGMGKVQETAVVRDGQIVVRPVMYLCLTYDHRLIEGAEGVGFLQTVKRFLEAPDTLA